MRLTDAITVAAVAHEGQFDKAGQPYILHPIRVMLAVHKLSEDHQVVALLHDVIEDTRYTMNDLLLPSMPGRDLRAHPVSWRQQLALEAVSRREGEDYLHYIQRCSHDSIATSVKIADLYDNLSRLEMLPDSERIGLEHRYEHALGLLGG